MCLKSAESSGKNKQCTGLDIKYFKLKIWIKITILLFGLWNRKHIV